MHYISYSISHSFSLIWTNPPYSSLYFFLFFLSIVLLHTLVSFSLLPVTISQLLSPWSHSLNLSLSSLTLSIYPSLAFVSFFLHLSLVSFSQLLSVPFVSFFVLLFRSLWSHVSLMILLFHSFLIFHSHSLDPSYHRSSYLCLYTHSLFLSIVLSLFVHIVTFPISLILSLSPSLSLSEPWARSKVLNGWFMLVLQKLKLSWEMEESRPRLEPLEWQYAQFHRWGVLIIENAEVGQQMCKW